MKILSDNKVCNLTKTPVILLIKNMMILYEAK